MTAIGESSQCIPEQTEEEDADGETVAAQFRVAIEQSGEGFVAVFSTCSSVS